MDVVYRVAHGCARAMTGRFRFFCQSTEDHKFAGSEFGRQRRFREAKVTTRDGRDQSAPINISGFIGAGGLGPGSQSARIDKQCLDERCGLIFSGILRRSGIARWGELLQASSYRRAPTGELLQPGSYVTLVAIGRVPAIQFPQQGRPCKIAAQALQHPLDLRLDATDNCRIHQREFGAA